MMSTAFICHCHDWDNQGAQTKDGVTEWQIACDVDRAISDTLKVGPGKIEPWRMERTLEERISDVNMLWKLAGKVMAYRPMIAIETHCNWSTDKHRNGFFVMAHHGSEHGRLLARVISQKISEIRRHGNNLGINLVDSNRQWIGTEHEYENHRQAFITQTLPPAVLVESCFLSNFKDAYWITQIENRRKLGVAIGEGIEEYFKEIES